MSRDKRHSTNAPDGRVNAAGNNAGKAPAKAAQPSLVRPPVDVVDGIPGRSANLATWKYVLMAIIFLAWVAFLIYIRTGAAE